MSEELRPVLMNGEAVILEEIKNLTMKRNDIAQTYRFLLIAQKEGQKINFQRINDAILKRWSLSGLKYIKNQAWTGKCFKKTEVDKK